MKLSAAIIIWLYAGTQGWSQEPIAMRGTQLMACSDALERFTKEETGSDIARYTINLRETPEAFEVVFVPDQVTPNNPGQSLKVTLGGKTAYGREVHYIISKEKYEILRTFFAR
jgi:hypothetical protein